MCKTMITIISIGVVGERIITQALYNEHMIWLEPLKGMLRPALVFFIELTQQFSLIAKCYSFKKTISREFD